MGMLTPQQIKVMGFGAVGVNVQISDKASFYGVNRISLGSHVRIDDFCVFSAGAGGIEIGNHIHIAAYTSLIGSCIIKLEDFCNLSSRVSIYSSSDDYSGASLTNPTVASEYKQVQHAPVHLGKHVIVGSGSVILPGITLEEGVAVGALSLVTENCAAFGIYAGIPACRIKERKRDMLQLEQKLLSQQG